MAYNDDARIAHKLLTQHDHNRSDRSPLTRENCGACVLNGYVSRAERADRKLHPEEYVDGPNYSGWARIYVQAGKPIPRKFWTAFKAERALTDSPEYVAALEEDILHYGIRGMDKYR